jgi:hypothetical protein
MHKLPIIKGREFVKDIPKGLLRTIIREDLEISLEEFCKLYSKYKGKK